MYKSPWGILYTYKISTTKHFMNQGQKEFFLNLQKCIYVYTCMCMSVRYLLQYFVWSFYSVFSFFSLILRVSEKKKIFHPISIHDFVHTPTHAHVHTDVVSKILYIIIHHVRAFTISLYTLLTIINESY